MTAGDRLIDTDGYRLVDALGYALVKDANDECPECCLGCTFTTGSIIITVDVPECTGCLRFQYPSLTDNWAKNVTFSANLNQEHSLDFVSSSEYDGVQYCTYKKILPDAVEFDFWEGVWLGDHPCEEDDHDYPGYEYVIADIEIEVVLAVWPGVPVHVSSMGISSLFPKRAGGAIFQGWRSFLFDTVKDNEIADCSRPTQGAGGTVVVSQEGI